MAESRTTLVVPTLGRQSLVALCRALATQSVPVDVPVVLVDDRRPGQDRPDLVVLLRDELGPEHGLNLRVVTAGGGGPARARNIGWRHARTPWVSFLDDDVVPDADWYAALLRDLSLAGAGVAGSQGVVRVPLPRGRRPTDWERFTAGLASATWITADMSYRRAALTG